MNKSVLFSLWLILKHFIVIVTFLYALTFFFSLTEGESSSFFIFYMLWFGFPPLLGTFLFYSLQRKRTTRFWLYVAASMVTMPLLLVFLLVIIFGLNDSEFIPVFFFSIASFFLSLLIALGNYVLLRLFNKKLFLRK